MMVMIAERVEWTGEKSLKALIWNFPPFPLLFATALFCIVVECNNDSTSGLFSWKLKKKGCGCVCSMVHYCIC